MDGHALTALCCRRHPSVGRRRGPLGVVRASDDRGDITTDFYEIFADVGGVRAYAGQLRRVVDPDEEDLRTLEPRFALLRCFLGRLNLSPRRPCAVTRRLAYFRTLRGPGTWSRTT